MREDYIHVVTTPDLPGYDIKEVKGLVWGTSVRAKFLGKDLIAIFRSLVGGEIKEYTDMINIARRHVIERMVANAKALGANAIISSHIGTTSQVLPGTVELFAYGTAVVVTERGTKRTAPIEHKPVTYVVTSKPKPVKRVVRKKPAIKKKVVKKIVKKRPVKKKATKRKTLKRKKTKKKRR